MSKLPPEQVRSSQSSVPHLLQLVAINGDVQGIPARGTGGPVAGVGAVIVAAYEHVLRGPPHCRGHVAQLFKGIVLVCLLMSVCL